MSDRVCEKEADSLARGEAGGGAKGGGELAILNILLSGRKKGPRSRKIVPFEKVRDSAVGR